MKILITGGLGFLGSHLADQLLKATQADIDIVDNCQSNVIQDVEDARVLIFKKSIEDYMSETAYDYIYHCASVVGPVGVLKYAGRISQLIIEETQKVADLALSCNAGLMFISTSELYGPSSETLLSESHPKIVISQNSARQEYAVGKLLSEISLLNLYQKEGLKVNIIRPFNIVGPRQSASPGGFVMPRFINQALSGKPLTIYNDGMMVRSFTHVLDIISAILVVVKNGGYGNVFNAGNPKNTIRIKDLATEIIKVTGSKSQIEYVDPVKLHGPLYREAFDKVADITKIHEELGWSPKWSLDETIQDCISYHRGQA